MSKTAARELYDEMMAGREPAHEALRVSSSRDAPALEKPRLRAIALRCVEPGGPFVLDQIYYGLKGHRKGPDCTFFDVLVEGEIRVEYDTRFQPCNDDHWYLFSREQRRRFDIVLPHERYRQAQRNPSRKPAKRLTVLRGAEEVRL